MPHSSPIKHQMISEGTVCRIGPWYCRPVIFTARHKHLTRTSQIVSTCKKWHVVSPFSVRAHHELQQLLLCALVQVGLLDSHQLACGDVACHVHLAQVIEAPPCDTVTWHEVKSHRCFRRTLVNRFISRVFAAKCQPHPAQPVAGSGLTQLTAL